MRRISAMLIIVAALVFVVSCGSTSSDDSSSDTLDDNQWRAITNSAQILAGILVSGAGGTLTVVNNSDAVVGAPALAVYDATTGEASSVALSSSSEIAAGAQSSASFTFPSGAAPEETALMLLSFGGDQAATFVTSTSYLALPPIVFDPAAVTAITPLSGDWAFEMDLSTDYLTGTNCPSTPYSMTSSGDCEFFVSNNGYTATWSIDDSTIQLNRSAIDSTFESATYYFPVETDTGTTYGTNSWALTPSSTEVIAGTLSWNNNDGCTAAYPIEMSYVTPATPTIIELCEGQWNVSYSAITCGATIINPTSLAQLPYPTGTLDVTYAGDTPVYLTFDTLTSYQALPYVGSNTYGTTMPNMGLGMTYDSMGYPLNVVGSFQITAVTSTMMTGVLTVNGFGVSACGGGAVITMTSVSGC